MTDVLVRLTAPSSGAVASGWVPADEVAAAGHLECRPWAPDPDGARLHLEGPDRLLLPTSMPPVRLVAGEATLHLAPTGAGWCWQIIERTPHGKTRYVLVPGSVATLDYADLVDVDPLTLDPTAEPEAAWWAMAGSTVTSGAVVGDDLILTRYDASTVNAGNVRGPQGDQGPKGDTGPRGAPGDPTAYELRGTGMPNGVVTASPGTYYTDTAGTNGAWRWLKTSGTGNTGWTVVYGDTGWRDLTALLLNGFTASVVQIRRYRDTVTLRVATLNGTESTSATFLATPSGLLPQANIGAAFNGSLGNGVRSDSSLSIDNYGNGWMKMQGSRSTVVAQTVSQYVSWPANTNVAWPTTLPGSPA